MWLLIKFSYWPPWMHHAHFPRDECRIYASLIRPQFLIWRRIMIRIETKGGISDIVADSVKTKRCFPVQKREYCSCLRAQRERERESFNICLEINKGVFKSSLLISEQRWWVTNEGGMKIKWKWNVYSRRLLLTSRCGTIRFFIIIISVLPLCHVVPGGLARRDLDLGFFCFCCCRRWLFHAFWTEFRMSSSQANVVNYTLTCFVRLFILILCRAMLTRLIGCKILSHARVKKDFFYSDNFRSLYFCSLVSICCAAVVAVSMDGRHFLYRATWKFFFFPSSFLKGINHAVNVQNNTAPSSWFACPHFVIL